MHIFLSIFLAMNISMMFRLPQTDESRAEYERLCELRHGPESTTKWDRKGPFWQSLCLEKQEEALDMRWLAKDSKQAEVIQRYFSKCIFENRWRIYADVSDYGEVIEFWVWDAEATAKCLLDNAAAMATGENEKESSLKPEPNPNISQGGGQEEDI